MARSRTRSRITRLGSGRVALAVAAVALLPNLVLAADDAGEHGASEAVVPATIWAIISFAVVLFILWKKLLPPILEAMDRRASEIRDSLAAAEKAKAQAEEMMARHQADLEAARKEAQQIIEEGKSDAERLRTRIVEEARKEAENISARAVREIGLAKQAALQELHLKSVNLSFDIANQLIRKNLDPKDHQDLIDDRIRRMETQQGQG